MEKYRHPANTEKARADAERARSGAWGTHADTRDRRARTRQASVRRDLRDQS